MIDDDDSDDPAIIDSKTALFDKVLQSWRTSLPAADLTAVSLSVSISRLAALFNRALEELVRPYGFGYGETEVLFYLLSAGKPYEMRPSDLTKGCFVTSGAITGRVDRLIRLSLVTRVPSLIDRREMVVRLTPNGQKLSRRLQVIVSSKSPLSLALESIERSRREALDRDMRTLLQRMEILIEESRDLRRSV